MNTKDERGQNPQAGLVTAYEAKRARRRRVLDTYDLMAADAAEEGRVVTEEEILFRLMANGHNEGYSYAYIRRLLYERRRQASDAGAVDR